MAVKDVKPDGLVIAGRVRRAFGIKGQLSVDWDDGQCPVKAGSGKIFVRANDTNEVEDYVVLKDHSHGNYNIVTLKGLTDRNRAETYRGSDIWVDQKDLPGCKDGEYYTYQLIDMKVITLEGEHLGRVTRILSTGSNDVYVVTDGDDELLIPAIADVVKDINLEKGIITVELIEGLRE